jgi:hypothetical protein
MKQNVRNDGGRVSSILITSFINKNGCNDNGTSLHPPMKKRGQHLIYTENSSLIFYNTKSAQSLLTVGFVVVVTQLRPQAYTGF